MDDHTLFLALEKMLDDGSGDPIVLPFSFLKAVTGNFSENQRIGVGGFGAVYKGTLQNGIVAIKKLHENIQILEKNFKSEVSCLIQVKHKNIVQFLGYCSETQHVMAEYEGNNVWADVRRRLFCFEYLSKGNLGNYLTEASSGLHWRVRFEIIKGICEGVRHLHQKKIIHMDLKPQNILLDDEMVPKIADFGLSRRLREDQSKIITENKFGSRGYLAPEFIMNGIITLETDIYSLGVIITEILMGCKECSNVDEVCKSWKTMFGASERHTLLKQVKVCAEIGINCKDDDPIKKRPAIMDIIRRLDEVDISISYMRSAKSLSPRKFSSVSIQNELLDIHPLKLCFPFEAKKPIQCSLNLINRTDGYVAYWIMPQFPDMYSRFDQPYILCPLSTLTFHVTMLKQEQPPVDAGVFEILMFVIRSERVLEDLISSIDKDPKKFDGYTFKRVANLGEVRTAMVTTAVVRPPREGDNCPLSSEPKIVWKKGFVHMGAIDAHPPTQPWILVGHKNYVSIWDYEKKERIVSLDVNWKACKLCHIINGETKINSVRFIPQRHWFVAGDNRGYIYVYTCHTWKEIKRFRPSGGRSVVSLAIHPTCPYLLSACEDGVIKLWDWDIGWACSRVVCHLFPGKTISGRVLVKFNPKDTNTFTSHDQHGGLKVWSIDLAMHITTINQNSTEISCDHVFTEIGGNNLVNIAYNTINIWDLMTRARRHTLCDTGCLVTAVACHPTLPLIAAGIKINDITHAAIRFWNSTNYRLLKTVSCTSGSMIKCLGFIGSKRVVIGTEYRGTIEVMEIDMDSLVCQQ